MPKIGYSYTEVPMSHVYNPESETVADIERLEIKARDIRKRVEKAHAEVDKRVLNRQISELKEQIEFYRTKLP